MRPMRLIFALMVCGCSAHAEHSFRPLPGPGNVDLTAVWCAPGGDIVARDALGKVYPLRGSSHIMPDIPTASSGKALARASGMKFERSDDGGASWVTSALPRPPGAADYGKLEPIRVTFGPGGGRVFVLAGYIAISDSLEDQYMLLLRSDDRGASWKRVWTGPNHGPMSIMDRDGPEAPGIGAALAVAPDGAVHATSDKPGAMLSSRDGGVSFVLHDAATHEQLADLAVSRDSTIYAVGDHGAIVASTDGGATYSEIPAGVASRLSAIAACSDGSIWIVGEHGTVLSRSQP